MAADFSPEKAVAIVAAHKGELGLSEAEAAAYIEDLRRYVEPKSDDRRAAVLIAVDAAKSLISIGIAFFAALGAFALSYRSTHVKFGFSLSVLLLTAAALLTIASMIVGFAAIGRAYKRGQNATDRQGHYWATKPLSGLLGGQSLTGLGALLCFGVAVLAWNAEPNEDGADAQLKKVQQSMSRITADADRVPVELSRVADQLSALAKFEGATAAISDRLAAIDRTLADMKARAPTETTPRPPVDTPKAVDWQAIQSALAHQGFLVGRIDGIPGANTRSSIRAYQRRIGANPDGNLTPEQMDDLLGTHR